MEIERKEGREGWQRDEEGEEGKRGRDVTETERCKTGRLERRGEMEWWEQEDGENREEEIERWGETAEEKRERVGKRTKRKKGDILNFLNIYISGSPAASVVRYFQNVIL